MDSEVFLNNPDIDDTGISIVKSKKAIKKGIKQNFKFLKLVNPFFSCKTEEDYAKYQKQLHTLLNETIAMKLALFCRTRPKK